MFFGGNKNINKKLGAFIIAFAFIVVLFGNFNFTEAITLPGQIQTNQQNIQDDEVRDLENEIEYEEGVLENQIDIYVRCWPNGKQNPTPTDDCPTDKTIEEMGNLIREQRGKVNNISEDLQDKVQGIFGEGGLAGVYKDENGCGPTEFGCHMKATFFNIIGLGANALIEGAGLFLRFTGILLNQIVSITIEGMDTFLNDNGDAVKNAWSIIRDIINILFIFGLLFVSLNTIIRGLGQKTKQLLITIIASALLINFSYFFTAVLIDVSNYLTIEIEKNISSCEASSNNPVNSVLSIADGGISNCVMDKVKLQSVLNNKEDGFLNALNPKEEGAFAGTFKVIISGIFGSFFIIITGMVFLILAILLAIRFIKLIFLLITSPVLFLGWVLPQLSNISKSWTKSLSEQLLFPPLVFLFIYISLEIANTTNLIDTTFFGIILNYILIMGFMIGSIVIAQKTGATGANFATKVAGSASIGLAARGTGSFGRRFIGKPAAALADKVDGTTRRGQLLKGAIKGVADRSFDVRNTKSFEGIAKATGLTGATGTPITKGYRDRAEEKANKEKERYDKVTKLTESEEREADAAYRHIEDNEKDGKLKTIKDSKKQLETIREDISDVSAQKKALGDENKDTQEWKDLDVKEKAIGMKLKDTREKIDNTQKELEKEYAEQFEIIKGVSDNAKERGKAFESNVRKRADSRIANILGSSDNLAARKIADSSRNKDGDKGELTKIADKWRPGKWEKSDYSDYEKDAKKRSEKEAEKRKQKEDKSNKDGGNSEPIILDQFGKPKT